MQQLTHTPIEKPSINIHINQQNIYEINIQRQELNKDMLIVNTLKGKLNSQQKTNTSRPVTKIKSDTEDANSEIRKSHFLVQENT